MAAPRRPVPSVSVVVPTAGRRPDELRRSLRIVLEDPSTTQVVVAADVGANGPLPKVPSDKRVRVIRVPADIGTPDERGQRAREFALEYVEADVVLALDDDVLPERGLVTGHALQHAGAEGTVVVGYMPVSWHDLPFRWRPAARYYSRSYEAACSRFEVCPGAILEGLWGGNFSVRRADWSAAAEATRTSGGYHGDFVLGLEFARAGLEGRFDRSLRAQHRYLRSLTDLEADHEASASARLRIHAAYSGAIPVPGSRPRRLSSSLALTFTTAVAATERGWQILRRALIVAAYAAEAIRLASSRRPASPAALSDRV